jgi:DNA-binding MarR family transcriptional regulator
LSNSNRHPQLPLSPDLQSWPLSLPARKRLPPLLRHAWFSLNQAFRRRISHSSVTPDQFTVLRTLTESDRRGLTQQDLTRAMSSDPNTIASLLERMESAGWLERCPHESDGRAHRIRLLPAGRKKFVQVREIAVDLQNEVLAALPEDQREGFLTNLSIIADSCRAAADASPRASRRPDGAN